jgi:hypothetical protein
MSNVELKKLDHQDGKGQVKRKSVEDMYTEHSMSLVGNSWRYLFPIDILKGSAYHGEGIGW